MLKKLYPKQHSIMKQIKIELKDITKVEEKPINVPKTFLID
jgi:hypothetical protein